MKVCVIICCTRKTKIFPDCHFCATIAFLVIDQNFECFRVQANYAVGRAAAASVSYLSEVFRKRQLEYSTALSGRTEQEPRWKECVDIASGGYDLQSTSNY